MSTLVLARKYRPRDFDALVGQEHVVQALANALTQQRLHHAYLFTGTRGVGKTTVSRILAKSLNCTGVDGQGGITAQPCGVCDACREIDAGRFIDYVELDAASNRGVDEITQLLDQAVYKPVVGRFKVYMVDEVHMLSTHAFNAMLKTLEEPPDYLKFVLATTDPQKVPPTVLSRCLQFNLRPIAPQTVQAHLAAVLEHEALAAEPGALRLIARAARGSMRDALSLTDQAIAFGAGTLAEDGVRRMLGAVDRGHAVRLVEALAAGDGAALVAGVDALRALGLSAAGTLEEMAALLQQMAVLQAVPDAADPTDPDAPTAQRLALLLEADETQLLYSIVLHGRAELGLAPDEYSGLVMVLLRMLAFRPAGAPTARASPTAAASTPRADAPLAVAAPLPVAARGVEAPGVGASDVEASDVEASGAGSPGAGSPGAGASDAGRSDSGPSDAGASETVVSNTGASNTGASHTPAVIAPALIALSVAPRPAVPGASAASPSAPVAAALRSALTPTAAPTIEAEALQPAAGAAILVRADEVTSWVRAEVELGEPPPWLDVPDEDEVAAAQEATALRRAAGQAAAAPARSVPAAGAARSASPAVAIVASRPSPAAAARVGRPPATTTTALQRTETGSRWAELVQGMVDAGGIGAMVRELAMQAECIAVDEPAAGDAVFRLRVERETLRAAALVEKLGSALAAALGRGVRIETEAGAAVDSPARRDAAERERRQQEAETIIHDDPLVRALMAQYATARIVPGSVRPQGPSDGPTFSRSQTP